MSHIPLLNCKIILGQYDISGDTNRISIARSQQDLSDDTFSATKTFKARIGGLGDGVIGMAGLVELTDDGQDEIFSTNMALSNIPLLISLLSAADFDRCKFGKIQQGQYQSGGKVGGRAEWTADGRISDYVLTDGNIMAVGAKTTTFNGVARQLGAMSATQKMYATLHATAKSAFTSAVFKVQSDDNSGFTSPTDRITFSTVTGLTAEHKVVSGAITDDYWRVICSSFTGTSLTIYIAIGIAGF